MKITEVRIEVREEEAEELANALRILLERAWPEGYGIANVDTEKHAKFIVAAVNSLW
jgi:uncharacterized protein YeaO (DUF488 family)